MTPADRDCDCCAGVRVVTPRLVPALGGGAALGYRIGTYADFLATLKARLSSLRLPKGEYEGVAPPRIDPLSKLTARDAADPAIALLDAFAVVADVLTFYQERIANEGYLPTAREFRSLV